MLDIQLFYNLLTRVGTWLKNVKKNLMTNKTSIIFWHMSTNYKRVEDLMLLIYKMQFIPSIYFKAILRCMHLCICFRTVQSIGYTCVCVTIDCRALMTPWWCTWHKALELEAIGSLPLILGRLWSYDLMIWSKSYDASKVDPMIEFTWLLVKSTISLN
jgi:hypothetical protein